MLAGINTSRSLRVDFGCVCGITEGKGSRKHFGALLLGAYRNGKLRYFGHSGTGFNEKGLAEAIDRLRPFFTNKPPVENPPKIPEKIPWVAPKLVCEVSFAEWTEDEQLRQTTLLGCVMIRVQRKW